MDKKNKYFITGIGTGVGKTICSALLAKLWQMDYWKPVQAGDLEASDSLMVQGLIGNGLRVYPERYKLHTAASPHQAAAIDGLQIRVSDFNLPDSSSNLLVEGAGGIFVPLNETEFMLDLMKALQLPVIVVCRDYLGAINHSLSCFRCLEAADLSIKYVVLNGDFNPDSARIIKQFKPAGSQLIHIPEISQLDEAGVQQALQNIQLAY